MWQAMNPNPEMSVKDRNKEIAKVRTKWQNENIGRVPVGVSGEQWMKSLPEKFQDEYLGKTQAELFRSGELKLNKLLL